MPEKGSLPEGWERGETESGIPYYINHHTDKVHWDHPRISEALSDIDGLNDIRYAAYRTAMKLRAMQKATQYAVKEAFRVMGLEESQNQSTLSVVELETLVSKIFHHAHQRIASLSPTESVSVTVSWILKCLDSGRVGSVNVRALKIILMIMCSAHLEDKYRYMFQQAAGGQIGVVYPTFTRFLEDTMLIPRHLMEGATFHSGDLESATNSCWSHAQLQPDEAITREGFLSWMHEEPKCIVWLPTMHRIATAETVRHDAKCSVCKIFPIVGLRYRCLKCSNVDLCQSCFWTQRTLKNHKVTHPFKEYCLETTTGDDVRDFAQQIKNKITRSYRHKAPVKTYLDYPHSDETVKKIAGYSLGFEDAHTRIGNLASRLRELDVMGNPRVTTTPTPVPAPRTTPTPVPAPRTTPTPVPAPRTTPTPVPAPHTTPTPVPAPRTTKLKSPESHQIVAQIERHESPSDTHTAEARATTSPPRVASLAANAAERRLLEERLRALEQENAHLQTNLSHAKAAAAAIQNLDSVSQTSHRTSSIGVNTHSLRAGSHEESIKMGEEQESLEQMVDILMDLDQMEAEDLEDYGSELLAAAVNVGRLMAAIVDEVAATQ